MPPTSLVVCDCAKFVDGAMKFGKNSALRSADVDQDRSRQSTGEFCRSRQHGGVAAALNRLDQGCLLVSHLTATHENVAARSGVISMD
jgi:hypothetical protein